MTRIDSNRARMALSFTGVIVASGMSVLLWYAPGHGQTAPVDRHAGTAPRASCSDPDAPLPVGERTAPRLLGSSRRAPAPRDEAESMGPAGDVPAGCLHVHIDAGEPSSIDGVVRVQRIESNDPATRFDALAAVSAPVEGGVARFADLPRGVLLVGVSVDDGPAHRALWVNSLARGGRLRFRLGGASIRGSVRLRDGSPAAGAMVRLAWDGGARSIAVRTAGDGTYDAGSLIPDGEVAVSVHDHPSAARFPERLILAGAGSRHVVSFGAGSDLVRLRMRLMAPDGSPVTAADGLPPGCLRLVSRDGRGRTLQLRAEDGVVDQWVEPGVHAIDHSWGGQRQGPRSQLGYQDADRRRRLPLSADLKVSHVVDGFVLAGRIAGDAGASVRLSATSAGSSTAASAEIGDDGGFRFVGVPPGRYRLQWGGASAHFVEMHPDDAVVVDLGAVTSTPARARSSSGGPR